MLKRLLLLGLALFLTAGLLTGCGGSKPTAEKQGEKTLSLVLDGVASRQHELEAVAQYLKKVGVDAQVRVWEKNALLNEIKAGNRQAYAQDWGSAIFDPFDLAVPKLKTNERGNYSFYSNAKFDELLEKGAFGDNDQEREKAYKEAQQILYQDAPWIFGYYLDIIHGVAANVQGYKPAMDNRINLHDVSLSDGKDTLAVGLNIDRIPSLDPANHREREAETVIRNMFDGLVTRTPDGKVVPEIAESWKRPSPTVYEFTIRPGIKFHNGDPLRIEDIVFTFERILSPTGINGKQSPRVGLLGPLKKVEKVDNRTVRFTLDKPCPQFLQLLVHTQIVPEKYLKAVGDQKFAEKPVGCGPFKLVEAKLDSQIVLERFDGYYGGSPDLPPVGPAKLKKVVFKMLPEPSTRVAALKAGEIQIAEDIPVDVTKDLQNDPKVKIVTTQGTRCYMIELNNKKITDPKVRQALNYAVNWDELLGAIYGSHAHRLSTAFLPSGFGFDDSIKPYPYNPEKAKQLLKEAGYKTP
ncbi:ABC transporter substrate-binding protein [Neomoorella mulderi]|uniref:Heme-binding protein A n=1 Tax=Moorella mulderi DSM 14980 TaxID=1122241 RepID=A0A151B070_9FIRM|nr:ABC transporter substrate-binding protein [Moorella mulderi]KYH33173.1 heme-binding protein A precursor [Moorella mulderi DSM 14980]